MAQLALGVVGAVISTYAGVGPGIGFAIGSAIGGVAFAPKQQGPRLGDTKVQISSYGAAIPITYGGVRIAGNVIWSTDLVESESEGGKGGPSVTTFNYAVSCAVAICEGEIGGIRRIWADAMLVYDAREDADATTQAASAAFAEFMTVYTGTETQLPDPTIEAVEGVGNVEAYRGVAYVVFNGLPLADYGNRIPNFSFETTTEPPAVLAVDDLQPLMVHPWEVVGGVPQHSNGGVMQVVLQDNIGNTLSTHNNVTDGLAALLLAYPPNTFYQGYWTSGSEDSLLSEFNAAGGAQDEIAIGLGPRYVYLAFNVEPPSIVLYNGGPEGGPVMCGTLAARGVIPDLDLAFMYSNTGDASGNFGHAGLIRFQHTGGAVIANPGYNDIVNNCTNYPPQEAYFPVASLSIHARLRLERIPTAPTFACFPGDPVELGIAELPGDPAFCISSTGDITQNYEYAEVVGLFRQLRILDQGPAESNAENYVNWYPLGPILPSTHPDYNNSAYWDAQAAAAGITGDYGVHYGRTSTVAAAGDSTTYSADAGSVLLSDIVTDLCLRAGLEAGDIDVTQLDDVVQGYLIPRQMPARNAIEPLRMAYFFDAVENGEKIVFVKRGGASVVTITADDLGATEGGESVALVVPKRAQETELPAEVNGAYMVREADYQTGTQQARRVTTGSQQIISAELPIVLTDDEAAEIVDVWMVDAWQGRVLREFSTTRKFTKYLPTDVVTVNDGEFIYRGRLIDKNEDGPLIHWKFRDEAQATYTPSVTSSPTSGGGGAIRFDGPMAIELMDIPALRDADDNAGFYAAGSGYRPTYRGGVLFKSLDDSTFESLQVMNVQATVGAATTVLGDFDGGNIVDEANGVTVLLRTGSLSSIGLTQLLNGGNAALVGNEILGFRTATLTATNTYRLTGLLRGRRGTEQHMSTHTSTDRFVLLNEATIYRVAQSLPQIGDAYYRGVGYGLSIADAVSKEFTNTGAALKPLSPVHLVVTTSGANYVVTWVRRTRIGGNWADGVDAPLSEASESYRVRLLDVAGVVISEQTVSTTTATVASDPNDVSIEVCQMSATVGAGFPATVEL